MLCAHYLPANRLTEPEIGLERARVFSFDLAKEARQMGEMAKFVRRPFAKNQKSLSFDLIRESVSTAFDLDLPIHSNSFEMPNKGHFLIIDDPVLYAGFVHAGPCHLGGGGVSGV